MTTDYYRIFYYVAECGNISEAAKSLFVTQPAVSKAIKNLELELGVVLFKRKPRGVELTSEGLVLYDHVAQAFKQLNEGEKLIKQLRDRSYGAIRIGISNTLCKYYFIPHLNAFHQVYPDLKIEIVNRTSTETIKLLEDDLLDCALVSEMPMSHGFDYEKLMAIQDIFVARRKAPKPLMTLKDLEKESMLLLEKKNATREHLEAFLSENSVKLKVDIEISSMEFLVEFAKIGLGVASVIGNFVHEEIALGQLYEWPVKPSVPKRSIGLLYKKERGQSIASQTFIDFMLDRKDDKGDNVMRG